MWCVKQSDACNMVEAVLMMWTRCVTKCGSNEWTYLD